MRALSSKIVGAALLTLALVGVVAILNSSSMSRSSTQVSAGRVKRHSGGRHASSAANTDGSLSGVGSVRRKSKRWADDVEDEDSTSATDTDDVADDDDATDDRRSRGRKSQDTRSRVRKPAGKSTGSTGVRPKPAKKAQEGDVKEPAGQGHQVAPSRVPEQQAPSTAPKPATPGAEQPAGSGSEFYTAVAWARIREIAFRTLVMKGATLASRFPEYTQKKPFEQEEAFRDHTTLAKLGLLRTPYYMYTNSYVVEVDPEVVLWMKRAGDAAAAETLRAEIIAKGADQLWNKWEPEYGVKSWRVIMAEDGVEQASGVQTREWVEKNTRLIQPAVHARAIAECPIENALPGQYNDHDRMMGSLRRQKKYPKTFDAFQSNDHRGIMHTLFEPPGSQPLPQLITIYNGATTRIGFVYTDHAGQPKPVTTAYAAQLQGDSSFRNIECLHEQHNMDRNPTFHDVDEVIVLTQFWGDNNFHWYEEDLSRMMPMLDFIRANPQIKVHVHDGKWLTSQGDPSGPIRGALEFLGIDPNRAVGGSVRAKVVYLPDGTPCGEPYMVPQMALRDQVRQSVNRKPVWDLWGSGVVFRDGLTRDTASAPGTIARPAIDYMAKATACVLGKYSALARLPHPMVFHSKAPADLRTSQTTEAFAVALAAAMPPYVPAAGRRPRIVLIRRTASRAVHNHAELESALRSLDADIDVLDANALPHQRDIMLKFADADIIVAPHGAGLTNMLSAWPGTAVFEFLTEEYQLNLVYAQMSLSLGMQYNSFVPAGSNTDWGMNVDANAAKVAIAKYLS